MTKNKIKISLLLMAVLISGCAALLPSSKQTTKSPWGSFDEARAAFDRIVIGKTTFDELRNFGFDPFSTPNVKILTYLDIIQRFMSNPSVKIEHLDGGLKECIDAKDKCRAYELEPKITSSKRYGNFWLDFLSFKRSVKETGWSFKALIVTVNDIVVYKLWGGSPMIDEDKVTKKPLGPLQDSDNLIKNLPVQGL
ncbi:MAG: hypothetical protein HY806_07785 [Nitrospirae bacterium]|nr:hypothetical protein [Nitrospirota bacterium]